MNLPCDAVKDLVSIYKDGLASESTAESIRNHLKQCPDCRKYYKQYDSINRLSSAKHNVAADISVEPSLKEYTELSVKLRTRRNLLIAGVALLASVTVSSMIVNAFQLSGKK